MNEHQTSESQTPGRSKPPPITIRNTRVSDLDQLDALQRAAYPQLSSMMLWQEKHWRAHIEAFPEGQWVAEVDGKVVGCCVNLRVPLARATGQHTWKEITGRGTLSTHEPDGDILYGAEIMVHPEHRRRGVDKKLYRARFDYIRDHGLRGFCAMGRIPNYQAKGKDMTPDEYVRRVVAGQITDRTLTAQIRSGCKVLGVVRDYLNDPKSGNAAAILVWENPEYEPPAADAGHPSRAEALPPDLVAAANK